MCNVEEALPQSHFYFTCLIRNKCLPVKFRVELGAFTWTQSKEV